MQQHPTPSSSVECDDVMIRHQCDLCCELFDREPELYDHLRRVHIGEETREKFPTSRISEADMPTNDVIQCRSQQAKHLLPQRGSKPYKCTACDYSCRTKQDIVKHFRCHTGERPYSCEVCNWITRDISTLYDHMRKKHPRFKPLKCSVCAEAFLVPTNLRRHLWSHIAQQKQRARFRQMAAPRWNDTLSAPLCPGRSPVLDPRPRPRLQCDVCNMQFNTEATLVTHLKEVHIKVANRPGKNSDQCFYRNQTITQKTDKHLQQDMEGNCPSTPRQSLFSRGNKTSAYQCIVCGYAVKSRSSMIVHVRSHTGEKPYKCRLCKYQTGYRSALYRHVRNKHPEAKPFKGTVCGQAFVTQTQLRSHVRCSTGGHLKMRLSSQDKVNDKPYKCTLCKYSANHKATLARHVQVHTGEKPYKCQMCEYETGHTSALWRHIGNKHCDPNAKPFKCTVCGKAFVAQTQLRWHLRRHTNEHRKMPLSSNPVVSHYKVGPCHRCTLCNYSSKQKCNMIKHIRIHTGEKPHGCRLCDFSSAQASSLYGHMDARHPGIKPYKCTVCGDAFLRPSELRRHLDLHVAWSVDHTCTLVMHIIQRRCSSITGLQTQYSFVLY